MPSADHCRHWWPRLSELISHRPHRLHPIAGSVNWCQVTGRLSCGPLTYLKGLRRAARRRKVPWHPPHESGCHGWVSAALHFDPTRTQLCALRDSDREHPVLEARIDLVRLELVAEREPPSVHSRAPI